MPSKITHNKIDVSRYVALGDSITAGYADGALFREGQLNSYPAIIAGQFNQQRPVTFLQPLMEHFSPGVNLEGESRLVLKKNGSNPNPVLTRLAPHGDANAFKDNRYHTEGPYNNLGVPGAKGITVTMHGFGNPANGPGNYNPFFTRMASSPSRASILSDALIMNPTFFSLFIGNNDALAYALSGGTQNLVISPATFESSFRAIVTALTVNNATGIVANLPSLEDIPYFNTIPPRGLFLSNNEAQSLNNDYAGTGISLMPGENYFVLEDDKTPGKIRMATEGEMILLDLLLDTDKDHFLAGKKPIPKKYSLTREQVAETTSAISAYNDVIRIVALEKQLAFVDINRLLKTARADRHYDTLSRLLVYARRGVFSLDGLHPNAFGQALMANEFIKEINRAFGCCFTAVRSHLFKSITFP